jgi:DNA adenine methylase
MSTGAPLQLTAARRYGTLSPLRYPGGKAALAGFFADLVERLALKSPTYVEPYAGGVGAGVALLLEGHVEQLVINDLDPAVYAFWASVVGRNDDLCQLVKDTPLSVSEWQRQKAVYRAKDLEDQLSLGFAFFYLNRTNWSGVLNAGPIGGMSQKGKYKIDARYNRSGLTSRLASLGKKASQILVSSCDGASIVDAYAGRPDTFLYIDPPYVEAGSSLYLNAFTKKDHQSLSAAILRHPKGDWVVTYDDTQEIRKLYAGHSIRDYQLYYSAHKSIRSKELAILSPSVARLVESPAKTECHRQ